MITIRITSLYDHECETILHTPSLIDAYEAGFRFTPGFGFGVSKIGSFTSEIPNEKLRSNFNSRFVEWSRQDTDLHKALAADLAALVIWYTDDRHFKSVEKYIRQQTRGTGLLAEWERFYITPGDGRVIPEMNFHSAYPKF